MNDENQLTKPTAPTKGGALVDIEQQRAIAETQAAMIMAKKFPRNVDEAMKGVIETCKRIGLADQAVYEYARGGTEITGPSIRLAEAIAQQWGNLQYGIRELSQANGESIVEAFAWDVQTNTRQIKIFHVEHKRHTRQGGYKLTDPRDIYELVANNGARRLRACILGTIPGDVIESALKQCEKTIIDNVDLGTDNIEKMIGAFERFSINRAMIEKRLQRKVEAITARNVLSLRRIFNALNDGMGKAEDYFDVDLKSNDAAKPRSQNSTAEDQAAAAKGGVQGQPPKPGTEEHRQATKPAAEPIKETPPADAEEQIPEHMRDKKESTETGALTQAELDAEAAANAKPAVAPVGGTKQFNFKD